MNASRFTTLFAAAIAAVSMTAGCANKRDDAMQSRASMAPVATAPVVQQPDPVVAQTQAASTSPTPVPMEATVAAPAMTDTPPTVVAAAPSFSTAESTMSERAPRADRN